MWATVTVLVPVLASGCGATKCVGAAPVVFDASDAALVPAEARACAFGVSCAAANGWWAFERSEGQTARSCIADWQRGVLDFVACAPNATNCDDWMSCAAHGYCPGWCAARGLTAEKGSIWVCDGDEVVVCDASQSSYGIPWQDCAAQGLHCAEARASASCTDGSSCTQPSDWHCDGNRAVSCDYGTLLGSSQDCGANGGVCVSVSLTLFSTAICSGSDTTPCDPGTFQNHCEGSVEVFCEFGVVARLDCADPFIDGDCVQSGTAVSCAPHATECTPATPDTCAGETFVTCGMNQRLQRVDCTTLGFRSCGDIGGRVACVN